MNAFRALVFGSLWLLAIPSLNAQSSGRVVGGSGNIEILRNGAWTGVFINELVQPGERVRTRPGAFATIEVTSGAVVTITQDSEVELQSGVVQLNAGVIQVISTGSIRVRAKTSLIEAVQYPVEMEVMLGNGEPEVNVTKGVIRVGGVVIRSVLNSAYRTYTTGGRRPLLQPQYSFPGIFVYPQVNGQPASPTSPFQVLPRNQ